MSTNAWAYIHWAYSIRGLSLAQRCVLNALAAYADEEGTCFPSHQRLADELEISRSTVMRALDYLKERGLVSSEFRHGQGGYRTSNRYQLHLEAALTDSPEPKLQNATQDDDLSRIDASLSVTSDTTMNYPEELPSNRKKRARVTSIGTYLDEDWQPTREQVAKAKAQYPELDVKREFEKFRGHWLTATGPTAKKRNWAQAWMNWLGKAEEFRLERGHHPAGRALGPNAGNVTPIRSKAVQQAIDTTARLEKLEQELGLPAPVELEWLKGTRRPELGS